MGVATGTFQTPSGAPVANGLYQWKLSDDAIVVGGMAVAPSLITGRLDSNGVMTSTFVFNDKLTTSSGSQTTYQLTIKDIAGGQVWNERYYLTGTAANLNTVLPGVYTMGAVFVTVIPPTQDSIQTFSANGTVAFGGLFNTLVEATAGASGINLTLPNPTICSGQTVRLIMMDTGPGSVTATGIMNFRSNYVISHQGQFAQFESDGAAFNVVGGN